MAEMLIRGMLVYWILPSVAAISISRYTLYRRMGGVSAWRPGVEDYLTRLNDFLTQCQGRYAVQWGEHKTKLSGPGT